MANGGGWGSRPARRGGWRGPIVVIGILVVAGVVAWTVLSDDSDDPAATGTDGADTTTTVGASSIAAPVDDPATPDCRPQDVVVAPRLVDSPDAAYGQAEFVITNVASAPCEVPASLSVEATVFAEPAANAPPTFEPQALQVPPAAITTAVPAVVSPGSSVAVRLQWTSTASADVGDRFAASFSLPPLLEGGVALPSDVRLLVPAESLVRQYPAATDAPGPIGADLFTPATTTEADAIDESDRASIYGVGAVRAGMSMQEVADATGHRVVLIDGLGQGAYQGGCGFARLGGVDQIGIRVDGPDGAGAADAVVGAIDVTGPQRTASGVGVGTTLADLRAAWGLQASAPAPGEYGGSYVQFLPADPAEQALTVIAWFEQQTPNDVSTVTSLVVGSISSASLQEGCA